ncbi:MAG: site-specific integrase [Bacteroidaceae bacterium]|nr:site-specific integrase [Bacteroidaceae bacterium]
MEKVNQPSKRKEPVKIRFKRLVSGNQSIYLDIYYNGCRIYEFLKLYLIPETDLESKIMNRQTLQAAHAIKAKRIIEIANGQAGITFNNDKSKMRLFEYLKYHLKACQKNHRGNSYINACRNMSNHLATYLGAKARYVKMKDVDLDLCKGFADHLKQARTKAGKALSGVTAYHYFGAFKSVLNEAVIDQAIIANPVMRMRKSDMPQRPVVIKEYLDADEIGRLANSYCHNDQVKRSFMFSCFTGLRLSDVRKLQWKDIKKTGDTYRYSIIMQKTQEPINNKLNIEAVRWLPDHMGDPEDFVFRMPSLPTIESAIAKWAIKARISKHVTFHTARHSCATMALMAGADLYTVSKLLGHRKIQTTTIYAAIVDKARDNAVDSLAEHYQNHLAQRQKPRT